MIVVDDVLVLRMLTNGALMVDTDTVATTCSWWWRLSARLSGSMGGPLGRRLERHDPMVRRALRRAVATLPDRVVVPERRELLPAMTELVTRYRIDLVAAEAVVAAEVLDAELVLATDAPALRTVARSRGVPYRVEP